MPVANDVTRLLDDIEARQQSVIEELDKLIVRIEAVIAEFSETRQGATAPAPQSADPPADEPQATVERSAEVQAEATADAPASIPRQAKAAA